MYAFVASAYCDICSLYEYMKVLVIRVAKVSVSQAHGYEKYRVSLLCPQVGRKAFALIYVPRLFQ